MQLRISLVFTAALQQILTFEKQLKSGELITVLLIFPVKMKKKNRSDYFNDHQSSVFVDLLADNIYLFFLYRQMINKMNPFTTRRPTIRINGIKTS